MLILQLVDVSNWPIKGPQGGGYNGILPTRMKLIHPSVVDGLRAITVQNGYNIAMSDMFRSPASSLAARQQKTGVQRPGFSGHNYGISIDIDIDQSIKLMGMSYPDLVRWMATKGWTCYRSDYQLGPEAWHFNFLNMGPTPPPRSDGPIQWITNTYGPQLTGDEKWVQTCLQQLKLYDGAIDGQFGAHSQAALKQFELMYQLPPTGVIDQINCWSLAIATCTKNIIPSTP
jgi:peptidoglycan hydrolase-like protein with peptidoglycan-binding domain